MIPMFTIPDTLKKLVLLPRFWMAVIALAGAIYLYVKGQISADILTGAIIAVAGIVLTVVTVENVATSVNAAHVAMNKDTVQAQVQMHVITEAAK